ncbi:oligoendopeptidase F [Mycoplasma sp. 1654_15]|uniref:oligoendopeptidase F n=1 Tax=Mycoplasma sp. 1654_15 TaxID=2725994 RepID=UPI00144A0619|nr:oligoendopeptidase F [Mycoplasma sp. 1654_15]QJB71246.1 oligoendopeptidase F [Mycoplasma sp. 1654_15]
MKTYKKYEDIPKKYRFDLDYLLEGSSIEDKLLSMDSYIQQLIENKDTQFDSVDKFLEYKKLSEEFSIFNNKVFNYISNKLNTNLVEPQMNKLFGQYKFKMSNFYSALGSIQNLFFAKKDLIMQWKDDQRVEKYKLEIQRYLDFEKHRLGNEVEEYLTKTSFGDISLQSTFAVLNNSETKFKDVISSSNKKHILTIATVSQLLKNKDESIRKQAYNNYLDGYLRHKETYSSLLYQHIKHKSVEAKSRNFNSLIEYSLFSDRISVSLLENLFKSVQKHTKIYDKFKKARNKFFKIKFNKPMKDWDNKVSLVKIKENYTIEEAQNLVLEALKPMGKEYSDMIKKSFNQRWVDYNNVPNKRSGAYSIGASYGLDKKYILMNYDFTFNSVSTLAHELGHSMHSYYSDTRLPYSQASYPIFLAEIASIFNELMLVDKAFENSNNDLTKFKLLEDSILEFYQVVIKQTKWAEFEFDMYNLIDQGQPINSYTEIEKVYANVMNKYENEENKVKIGNKSNIYSVIVPHFYYGYYVYKYAIGYIVANVFFQRYKQEGKSQLENYINKFLSAGGSNWPALVLKEAGIDLEDPKIYQQAFSILEDNVDKYIKLGNKLFKK